MASESRPGIDAVEPTAFGLDRDSVRPENCAFTLTIEMGRQSFLMQFCVSFGKPA